MTTSELITPAHLARKALIYIRQSTPQQVLSNQESLRLQYALQLRALELGWRSEDIQVIDCDLGRTGAVAQNRQGFQEVVARVTLGEAGILLSSEVTRLSRNCSDWYPLLDICGYRDCLIADRDGIYDPASTNGRLLLGLKGQLSEFELHTIRSRLTAGLLNKAQRGELALALPMGLVRQEDGRVLKDPNQEIQDRIQLVFDTFLRVKSANRVLRFFNQEHLTLPQQDRFGDLTWNQPSVAALLSILKNPAFAGAFVYGRSQTHREPGSGQSKTRRLPFGKWKIVVKDKYPTYISWETFERIQALLLDNYAEYDRNKTRGVPRPGATLLQGIVYCGECGHKMLVQYKGGPEYQCNFLHQQYQVPVCQRIRSQPIDDFVVQAFFQALSPIELEVYEQALQTQQQVDQQARQAQEQQLERLRYQAALAQHQYNQVDPENRLVAAELERRWGGRPGRPPGSGRAAGAATTASRTSSLPAARTQSRILPHRSKAAPNLGSGRAALHPKKESLAALPDRQGGHSPSHPGQDPDPHRLERWTNHHGHRDRHGGRLPSPFFGCTDGEHHPRTHPTGQNRPGNRATFDPPGSCLTEEPPSGFA
jgi:DNA invertase Pin-like site-specific DNA recombinase